MAEQKNYHSLKAVSSHSLSYFEDSPIIFKMLLDEELEREEKRYLDFGRQVHMKILEPKLFKDSYIVLDYDTPSSEQQKKFCEDYLYLKYIIEYKADEDEYPLIKAYKDNYKTSEKDEKILEKAKELKNKLSKYIEYLQKRKKYKDILTFAKKQKIDNCYDSVKAHKLANDLLFENETHQEGIISYNELEILWNHPLYPNIPCKSMIDRLIIDTNNKTIKLIDIKTAISLKKFKETIYEFNYHRQMAFYMLAIYWYIENILKINIENYKFESYIVAIRSTSPFDVKVIQIPIEMISEALNNILYLLEKLNWHYTTGLWDYTKEYYEGIGLDKLE